MRAEDHTSTLRRKAIYLTGKGLSDGPEDCPFGTTEEDVNPWANQEDRYDCSQPNARQET